MKNYLKHGIFKVRGVESFNKKPSPPPPPPSPPPQSKSEVIHSLLKKEVDRIIEAIQNISITSHQAISQESSKTHKLEDIIEIDNSLANTSIKEVEYKKDFDGFGREESKEEEIGKKLDVLRSLLRDSRGEK